MNIELHNVTAAGVKQEVAEKWIDAIRQTCERFEINTKRRIAGFLSQCAHESGGFTMLTENLNYRAATMAACWPNRFAEQGTDKKPKKDAQGKLIPTKVALALEKHPEQIANIVYASRMGNGPTESGEGWKFRGRGLKQLTGKDNYTRCGNAIGFDLVSDPDKLLEPQYAALSAGWFFSSNNCGEIIDSDADDAFIKLTKKINGGTIGLEDRSKRFKAVLKSFE